MVMAKVFVPELMKMNIAKHEQKILLAKGKITRSEYRRRTSEIGARFQSEYTGTLSEVKRELRKGTFNNSESTVSTVLQRTTHE